MRLREEGEKESTDEVIQRGMEEPYQDWIWKSLSAYTEYTVSIRTGTHSSGAV